MMLIEYRELPELQYKILMHARERGKEPADFAICPSCEEIEQGEGGDWCACAWGIFGRD